MSKTKVEYAYKDLRGEIDLPRPKKRRHVCRKPDICEFYAGDRNDKFIEMTLDEYETVRLIDYEGFTQEECSKYMEVARTTVQQIYDTARKKMAKVIVLGVGLRIRGGDYVLCDGQESECSCGGCVKHRQIRKIKEILKMRKIAVTYQNGEIFGHFGHTEQFKVYDVEDGKIVSEKIVSTNGSGHGALAGLLSSIGADTLICGGIGGGAQNALAAAGVKLYGGVSGSADDAVNALLQGNLDFDPDVHCDHHQHHNGECGHDSCGSHGCSGNNI